MGESGLGAGGRATGSRRCGPTWPSSTAGCRTAAGVDVCRDVRSVDPAIAALILTSYDDDEALFAAIMAGAAGYVLKQIAGTDLVDAVRRVAAGQSLLDPAVTAPGPGAAAQRPAQDDRAGRPHRAGAQDPRR